MTIGERIKKRREELQLTLDDIAKKLGVARQTVFKYENDIVKKIPYDKVEQLSSVLKVSPSYLFGWDEEQPKDAMFSLKEAQNLLMSQEAILFDGEPMDDETRELLLISLKSTMILAEKLSKKRKK